MLREQFLHNIFLSVFVKFHKRGRDVKTLVDEKFVTQ